MLHFCFHCNYAILVYRHTQMKSRVLVGNNDVLVNRTISISNLDVEHLLFKATSLHSSYYDSSKLQLYTIHTERNLVHVGLHISVLSDINMCSFHTNRFLYFSLQRSTTYSHITIFFTTLVFYVCRYEVHQRSLLVGMEVDIPS